MRSSPAPLSARRAALALLTLCLSGCGNAYLQAGRDAIGGGRYDEAVRAFERALEDPKAEARAAEGLASAYRGLGGQALRAQDCLTARRHIELASALTRPLLVDHQAIYECASARGADRAQIKADRITLATLGDKRSRILAPLMRMHLEDREYAEAISYVPHLESRFAIKPSDRGKLAQAYLRLERFDEAYAQLVQVVALDPSDALARLKLAELQARRGEDEMARRTYEALILDFRDNPVVYLRYAAFAKRRGDEITARAMVNAANRIRGIKREDRELRPLRKSRR